MLQPRQAQLYVVAIHVNVVLLLVLLVFLVLLIGVHLRGQDRLLKLRVRVKDEAEVTHGHDRVDAFLEHIPRPLELPKADVVVRKLAPESAHFVREPRQATADNCVHFERPDLLRVLRAHVAEPHPHLVLRVPARRHKVVVVDAFRKLLRRLIVVPHRHQVVHELLPVLWVVHQVPTVDLHCRLLDGKVLDPLQVEAPNPVMLGDGEGLQRAVKGPASPRATLEVHEQFAVVQPNPRHFVQVHQSTFVCVH
mmetsp:Transcript_11925/g.34445  ORF Transcript_11925/g.34445 Transcript_11925/m.34445 type:complete len:251 (-) Transcript_11925:256-1008(-)